MPSKSKKQTLLTAFFKPSDEEIVKDYNKEIVKDYNKEIVKGYNNKTGHYHCFECGVDMGNYPGQLCKKSFCDGIY